MTASQGLLTLRERINDQSEVDEEREHHIIST